MDIFKYFQLHSLGKGGINCSCCNNLARKHGGRKVDKNLNRIARARVKELTKLRNDG
jgi:hypothetical protein